MSSDMTQPTQFKITSPNQQLARRLRFPSPPSYSALTSKILSLWGSESLTAQTLGLSYVDRDGDRCVLSSSEELAGLFDELCEDGKGADVVRLQVVVLGEGEGGEHGLGEDAMQMVEREADEPAVAAATAATPSEARATEMADDPSHAISTQREASMADLAADAASPADAVPDIASEAPSLDTQSTTASVASDPPDEFITADTPTARPKRAQPAPAVAEPSLLSDLSSLFTSFASSPAMSALLTRAATGVYTPTLASSVQTHAASAATQAAAAQSEIQRVLGQVHGELRKNGMHGVDGKLRELEAMTAGWTAQLRAGLAEVQRMADERRAAAAAQGSEPEADTKEKPTEAEKPADTAEGTSTSTSTPGTNPAMPGAFAPPAATLFGDFNVAAPVVPSYEQVQANLYPAPPGAPLGPTQQQQQQLSHPRSFLAEFSSRPTMVAPQQSGVAPGAYPALPVAQPTVPTFAGGRLEGLSPWMGARDYARDLAHHRQQHGKGAQHRRRPFVPRCPPGSFPQQPTQPASQPPAEDVVMANPWLEGGPVVEVWLSQAEGGTLLERVIRGLIEMHAMNTSIEAFLRGMLAVRPEAPEPELITACLQYNNHGFKEAVLELSAASRQPRADGATTVLTRQEVLRRLGEMSLDQDNIIHLVNGQLAVDPRASVEDILAATVRLAFREE